MADQLRGPVGGERFEVSGVSGAAGICYENMFGEELRHAWDQANPSFILNTANLGWFSEAVLPPDGKIERLASAGAQNMDLTLVTATGKPTPFVRLGLWPLIGLLVLLMAGALALAWRENRSRQA